MCGIVGEYRCDGRQVDPQRLVAMRDALAHRGPDAEGLYWVDRHVGLAHRRLAVIDLSAEAPTSRWPRRTATLVISFNGEIYNFRDLRRASSATAAASDTRSDTEVLIWGYRAWGIED